MKKLNLFVLLYILLNLHMLRNISLVGYLAILAFVYIPIMLYCLPRFMNVRLGPVGHWFVLYFITALWSALVTFMDYGINVGVYASVRYFMTMPIALAAFWFLPNEHSMRKMLWMFCLIVLIGLLTIPLQYVVGPIAWFAQPGGRAGMVRYSTLLGNLTAAGGVVPYAIFITLVLQLNPFLKVLLLGGLCVGAVLTLQKSALLGIPLALGVYIVYCGRQLYKRPRKLIGILAIGLLAIIIGGAVVSFLGTWPVWQKAVAYAGAAFVLEENVETVAARGGDVSIQESIRTRLFDQPQRALADLYKFKGGGGYLLGGGFGMVGESLVRPGDSPFVTAHNGYVDFVLIGGFFHLLAFCGLVYSTLRSQWVWLKNCRANKLSDEIPTSFIGVIIIALVSLLFSGGLTFQPVTGCLFWMIVGVTLRLENKRPLCQISI